MRFSRFVNHCNCVIRKLEDLSVDEFLLSGDVDSADEDEDDSEGEVSIQNGLKTSKKKELKPVASKL